MNQNPYAPPQAPFPNPGAPNGASPFGYGPSQPWAVGEVVERGWALFKNQWMVLVPVYLIAAVLASVPGIFASFVNAMAKVQPFSREYFVSTGVTQVASLAISAILGPGQVRILVAVARGEQADVGMLFSGFDRSLAFLGTTILTTLACVVGMLFFVVPGIYIACALFSATMFSVDGRLGPVEAIRASFKATTGQRGAIFLLFLACFGIVLLGFAACCVGIVAAGPLAMLIQTIVYLRISGRGDEQNPPPPPPYAGPVYGTGYNG